MKTFFVILFAFIAATAMPQNIDNYLRETNEMVKQKKYQEANERFIWFQDSSIKYEPAMIGVRSSFALLYWKNLADVYPPAMQSMKEMRDKKTNLIIDSNAAAYLFADVAALNRELDETQKTLDLFEKIDKADHNKAKRIFFYTKQVLFDKQRYDILQRFGVTPVKEFELVKGIRNMSLTRLTNNERYKTLKSYTDNNFADKCLALIKFSIAINDIDAAKKIKEEAQVIVNDNRLRDVKLVKE